MNIWWLLTGSAFGQVIGVVDAASSPVVHTCGGQPPVAELTGIASNTELRISDLISTGEIDRAVVFPAGVQTPVLEDLLPYPMLWVTARPGEAFADPEALGDVLADYVLMGGGLVVAGAPLDPSGPAGLQGNLLVFDLLPVDLATATPATTEFVELRVDSDAWHAYGAETALSGGTIWHLGGLQTRENAEIGMSWIRADGSEAPATVVLREPADGPGTAILNADPDTFFALPNRPITAGLLRTALGRHERPASHCSVVGIIEQDLNCNGLDVSEESSFDPTLPDCDPDPGSEYPESVDRYYLYHEYGCELEISGLDGDEDGFGYGLVTTPIAGSFFAECDNCPATPNPEQWDADCDGFGDLCDVCPLDPFPAPCSPECGLIFADWDEDGIEDGCDACPCTPNGPQDSDEDGIPDNCDVCPFLPGNSQVDSDLDGRGDDCDNCPDLPTEVEELDSDQDGLGDACDVCPLLDEFSIDTDGDGVGDLCDLCPTVIDPLQEDRDADGLGDFCDNCPRVANIDQIDTDADGFGDACDRCPDLFENQQSDIDDDGLGDLCDLCPEVPDPDQIDADGDGYGNFCDPCRFQVPPFGPIHFDDDDDGVGNICDNCLNTPNFDQADADLDGKGDACDDVALRGGGQCNTLVGAGLSPWMVAMGVLILGMRRRSVELRV